jgi:hypothetical protein
MIISTSVSSTSSISNSHHKLKFARIRSKKSLNLQQTFPQVRKDGKSRRKEARREKAAVKQEETNRRLEEIKRLKNLKKKEIERRLKEISKATGNEGEREHYDLLTA